MFIAEWKPRKTCLQLPLLLEQLLTKPWLHLPQITRKDSCQVVLSPSSVIESATAWDMDGNWHVSSLLIGDLPQTKEKEKLSIEVRRTTFFPPNYFLISGLNPRLRAVSEMLLELHRHGLFSGHEGSSRSEYM